MAAHGESGGGRRRMDPPTWTERIVFVVARVLVAGMLIVALSEEMPRLYDLLLRVTVCLVALWGCWFMPRLRRWGWAALFLVTVLLFNPFAPPPFPPWLWRATELVWAGLFVLSLAFVRPVPRQGGADGPGASGRGSGGTPVDRSEDRGGAKGGGGSGGTGAGSQRPSGGSTNRNF